MICSIILDTNAIIETSKNMKETMPQEEIQLKTEKCLKNFQNNNNYGNIDTINYNANTIDSLKQINSIIILFCAFGYDIVEDRAEKENEFKLPNKNVDCCDFVDGTIVFDTFDNGFVFSTLSPTTLCSRVASREAAFDFHAIDIELPESIVLK